MSKQQMHSADAAWLHMDRPTNLMVVNSVLWFDEPMDLERSREVVRERMVEAFPRFRQRVVEPRAGVGLPYWEDDPNFNLDRHLHHIALPAPGDSRALQELVGDLMSTPLDRSKPLWDIYMIDGYGAGSAQVSRIHHSIADGIALGRLLFSMTDERPDAGLGSPVAGQSAHGRVNGLARPVAAGARLVGAAAHEGLEVLAHPRSELSGLVGTTAKDSRALAKLLLTPSERENVLRGRLSARQTVTWSAAGRSCVSGWWRPSLAFASESSSHVRAWGFRTGRTTPTSTSTAIFITSLCRPRATAVPCSGSSGT